jgi:hypothetical protein
MGRYWITVNGKIIDPDEDKIKQEAQAIAQQTPHPFSAVMFPGDVKSDSICTECNKTCDDAIHQGRGMSLINPRLSNYVGPSILRNIAKYYRLLKLLGEFK